MTDDIIQIIQDQAGYVATRIARRLSDFADDPVTSTWTSMAPIVYGLAGVLVSVCRDWGYDPVEVISHIGEVNVRYGGQS
jgi:hypothetical protein